MGDAIEGIIHHIYVIYSSPISLGLTYFPFHAQPNDQLITYVSTLMSKFKKIYQNLLSLSFSSALLFQNTSYTFYLSIL